MSEEKAEEEAAEPARAAAVPAKKVPTVKPMRRAAEPVKEVPKKVTPRTVKGKIAAIQKAAAGIYSGARSIQSDARKQMKENQEAVAKIQSGVRSIQSAIRDHMKKHQDAVVALQSAILEQMKENHAYVRDFYG